MQNSISIYYILAFAYVSDQGPPSLEKIYILIYISIFLKFYICAPPLQFYIIVFASVLKQHKALICPINPKIHPHQSMYNYAKIHLCSNNYVNLHNYCSTNVFLQIYTITIAQLYFFTMIHRLISMYFEVDWKNLHSYCSYENECFTNYLD